MKAILLTLCNNREPNTRGTSILTSTHHTQTKSTVLISIKTDISHRKEISISMETITLVSTHHNTLSKIGKTSSNTMKVAKTKEIQEMRQQVPIIF